MMNTYLILDASNLIYRSFFANIDEDDEMTVGLCYHIALTSLSKYHRKFNATDVVVAFDMPNSWRKLYTKDKDNCITRKLYKGTRRQGLTESQKNKLFTLDKNLEELADLLKSNTGIIVLKRAHLEADDLIAGFTQQYKHDKHVIISSDKDFIQLLDNGNVSLIDPNTDKPRDLADWDYDANYFMFEKCFRGDPGDNVQSSYPRLQAKKIKTAYINEFDRTNIMNHEFTVIEKLVDDEVKTHTYKTKELFEENKLLMDLTAQPEGIRELITDAISDAVENRAKFNYVSFLKFCGKHNLQNILTNIDKFTALLSGKGKKVSY